MGVLQKNIKSNFTIVNNTILTDRNLDIKLRGLLITMISLPPNWNFSIAGLQKILPDGRDAIASALKKLEQFGYLTRTTIRNEKGKIIDIDYTIYDEPCFAFKENLQENNSISDITIENETIPQNNTKQHEILTPKIDLPVPDYPVTGFPYTDNPDTGKPHAENPPQLNTNKYNTKELNTKELNINQSIYHKHNDGLIDKEYNIDNPLQVYSAYREIIKKNIDYESLMQSYPQDINIVNEIAELMVEIVSSNRKSYTISGAVYLGEIVKARMLKLEYRHIEHVIISLTNTFVEIKNIKAYLISMLFNSYTSCESYLQVKVNADMRGG